MKLAELLQRADVPDIEVTDLYEHTAEVQPGSAFIAVAPDAHARREHAEAALARGAALVLADTQRGLDEDVGGLVVTVDGLVENRGTMAARFYDNPSETLACAGVTGTNGKTSIAYHLADLSSLLGQKCGYSGTLGWGFLEELHAADLTTTNPVALQRRLAALRTGGAVRASLEVSSHALDQGRIDGLALKTAIFSNLTRDHLDYHGSMEAYGAAKARLFTDFGIETAVISLQTPFGRELAERCSGEVITYGTGGDVTWFSVKADDGLDVRWRTPWGGLEARLPVVAEFAVANVTGAMIALLADGVEATDLAEVLAAVRAVPGRLELVERHHPGRPAVVIDYAHTPDAVDQVLRALQHFCAGDLICVVGCGGDRDKGKRPLMAQAAARHSQTVWLTSDNPRSEDPRAIIEDMRRGLDEGVGTVCPDRAEAICRAIRSARAEDVVVVAGKGHEDYQEISGFRHPFSDRQVARDALEGLS